MILVLIVCIAIFVRLGSATSPSRAPSCVPSRIPSGAPSRVPSGAPSLIPTSTPSVVPKAQWVADSINITTQCTTANAKIDYYMDISSNSLLFDDEVGNYRLNFHYKNRHGLNYVAQSGCIKGTAKGVPIQKTINNLNLYYRDSNNETQVDPTGPVKTMQSIYTIKVKSYFNPNNHTTNYQYQLHMEFYSKQRLNETLSISLSHEECAPLRTIGQWDDPYRWDTQQVPTALTEVTIPADAGVIKLSQDVSVSSLTMLGGHILGYDTYCPYGWSVEPGDSSGIKCYQLHENPVPFNEAERTCNAVKGLGSESRHLVHIRNRAELLVVQRMCRGLTGYAAHSKGCWIGLWDQNGSGDFRWISPVAIGTPTDPDQDVGMFLDWRRDEPNNHTISEGLETPGGERCAALVPWQEDPLLLEQGSWNDDSCNVEKPFVCQIFGNTARYTLTVHGHTTLTSGRLEGGIIATGAGATDIAHVTVFRSGRIHVSTGGASCALGKVILQDGASLEVHSNAFTMGDAYLGELTNSTLSAALQNHTLSPSFQTMQSNVYVAAGATLLLGAGTMYQNVTINARAFVDGTLYVSANTDVYLFQGADMSKSTVTVAAASSKIHLSGYNSRLSTYDAYELQVSHRGEVNGEFYRDFDREEANMHLGNTTGVYRLRVGADVTRCIPYNATASELTTILNALPSITQRSGVTVRRYGSPTDPRFRFGYTYRIETDSVRTQYYAQGPLSMAIHCYGFDNGCGCAETKVVLVDATGMPQCPASSTATERSPLSDPNACVVAPTLGVSVISSLARTRASGAGSIVVEEGVHRFPPISTCTLAVTAGTGVVASDTITWSGISVTGGGRLVVAGTSWASWDSTYALYAPEWTTKRGELRSLNTASPFLMSVDKFYLSGLGSVLSSCPSSNMTWNSGTWDGGIIGGRSTLNIMQALNATGTTKSLRYGMTLFINEAATVKWTSGNISLADGADFTVEGQLVIDNSDGAEELFIGMAQLLEAPASDPTGAVLLSQDPGRDWHGYYGDELTAELRGGWYQNPLCGDQCLATNHLTIRAAGAVVCRDDTQVTFSLPLDLVGESTLTIRSNVDITMASGGICGNKVVVDISSGTKLELSGGRMLMEATCTIQGQGDLLVTGGSHDLSFSIDARITIEGGTMVWPDSRGSGQTITFNGGLVMQKTGALIVFPFSTNIVIYDDVYLRDESLIQFPLIGVAAQASLFDEQDAPDPAPRGILTSNKTMRWEGGTLRGKADFKANGELFLDGGKKYIKSLAKLVNQGHCEWGTGDLISSDSGDFLNLGTVQMMAGVRGFASNAMYQGTELPIESGGDVFALEYHSWDMDNGGLDYTQYVEERTRFVSRAPNGWTVEEQKAAEGL